MPHLLLLTDGHPSMNGAGISQTLYNLLEAWQGAITVLTGAEELLPVDEERFPAVTLRYNSGRFRPWRNRLGHYVNPGLAQWRMAWLQRQALPMGMPPPQWAWVLVSTTVPEKLLMAHKLLQAGYTVIPYFMDDWLADNTLHWKGGSLQQCAADILRAAPARIYISKNLQRSLEQRYALPPVPSLVVHNPAPSVSLVGSESGKPPAPSEEGNVSSAIAKKIIYAGSIWPMHADALVAVAQAVHRLAGQGFTLDIYAPPAHWRNHAATLEGPGVNHAGWLPYAEVLHRMPESQWLLCTASFLEQHIAFSRSSVQTKLTDYCSAGRPILVVGPECAASGEWVEEHGCGYWLKLAQPNQLAEAIAGLAKDTEGWDMRANRAKALAHGPFSKPVVQERLYTFLQQVVPNA